MRVLIITSAFPKDNLDSQGIIIAKLVQNLSKKGLTISVLAPHVADIPFMYQLHGAKIFRVPYFIPTSLETLTLAPGIYYHIRNSILAKIQLISLLLCETIAIMMICKQERIDIIHSHWIVPHGLTGMIAAYFLKIPHICSIHGTDVTITKTCHLLTHLVRFIAHRCSVISTNSRYTQSLIESICTTRPNLERIPMGVDISLDSQYRFENKNQESSGQIILYVGRLIQWKGLHILIHAMKIIQKKYSHTCLYIVGDGVCQEHLQELAIQLKLEEEIIFLGRLSEEELTNWYQRASVFVLPSIMYNNQTEGLGVVLLEAMSLGLPVIGSDTGGIPDIINDGVNGLLVPPGDSTALAEAITRIMEDPELADRFRMAGLETVKERFSWDKISDQFIEVYQRVLNESNEV